MKCYYPVVILFCLISVHSLAADEGDASRSSETSMAADFRFDGVWKPKAAILSGTFLPPPAVKDITLTIDKDIYEVTVAGEEQPDRGTFTLDETATPMRMTIKSQSGPNNGKTILAIYEVKNADAMRVCYDLSGTAFPKEFKAPKGSQHYVVGYRRQVDKAADDANADSSPDPKDE